MGKFEVGKVYRIIGHSGEIVHLFGKWNKVTLVKIAGDGEGHLYKREDGLQQFVSDCDVIECRSWLKLVFLKVLNKKKKGV